MCPCKCKMYYNEEEGRTDFLSCDFDACMGFSLGWFNKIYSVCLDCILIHQAQFVDS